MNTSPQNIFNETICYSDTECPFYYNSFVNSFALAKLKGEINTYEFENTAYERLELNKIISGKTAQDQYPQIEQSAFFLMPCYLFSIVNPFIPNQIGEKIFELIHNKFVLFPY